MNDDHPPYLDQNPQHKLDIAASVAVFARLFSLHATSRIVDLGCNTGDWLRGFIEAGYTNVLGIDQECMRAHLLISESHFATGDLRHALDVKRAADLVLCMEVGEHLEERYADQLVATCIEIAGRNGKILFSAATRGQGGHGHINEQPHSYWAAKFTASGYSWDESIRAALPPQLVWWYRHNMAIVRRASL